MFGPYLEELEKLFTIDNEIYINILHIKHVMLKNYNRFVSPSSVAASHKPSHVSVFNKSVIILKPKSNPYKMFVVWPVPRVYDLNVHIESKIIFVYM